MRYNLLILTAIFSASLVRAQGVPEGPSPMAIPTQEEMAQDAALAGTPVATNTGAGSKASFLMDAGVQYADEGEYVEAEQAYLRALEVDPKDPNIRFRLSTLYIQMKRYSEAAKLLEALTTEFPDSPQTQNNLAWVYATGGEMKNGTLALRHAREALLIDPNSASLWNTLAEAYYMFGQYEKALRTASVAIELLKEQSAPQSEISAFEAQLEKIQRADKAYRQLFGPEDEE